MKNTLTRLKKTDIEAADYIIDEPDQVTFFGRIAMDVITGSLVFDNYHEYEWYQPSELEKSFRLSNKAAAARKKFYDLYELLGTELNVNNDFYGETFISKIQVIRRKVDGKLFGFEFLWDLLEREVYELTCSNTVKIITPDNYELDFSDVNFMKYDSATFAEGETEDWDNLAPFVFSPVTATNIVAYTFQ